MRGASDNNFLDDICSRVGDLVSLRVCLGVYRGERMREDGEHKRGRSGVRECLNAECGHMAMDHRTTSNSRLKPRWCTVPDCTCEAYQRE